MPISTMIQSTDSLKAFELYRYLSWRKDYSRMFNFANITSPINVNIINIDFMMKNRLL